MKLATTVRRTLRAFGLPSKVRIVDEGESESLAAKMAEASAQRERDRFWERVQHRQNALMRERAGGNVRRRIRGLG